jgi:tetratricopeptide (TPR) repeat protein
MLETIREFAAMQLREGGEESAARDRHLDQYVAFAEAAELRSREGVTAELLDDVEVERDNLRAALVVAAGEGDPERQLRLVTSLRIFLKVRGPAAEDRRMVADALARRDVASPVQQGRILISAGIHALNDDDGERALVCFDEARELLLGAGDVRGAALADANASTALSRLGREADAMERSELARQGFRAVGAIVAESQVTANLARSYEHAGDLGTARAYLVEALELQERGGFAEARAYTLAMLGYLSEREGDLAAAAEWTAKAIAVSGDLQADEYLGYALLFAADLVQRRGDQERAARLLGASTAAFSRAAVVPQDEEAARAVRVRDALSGHAQAKEEGAALDRTSSVELGVASLSRDGSTTDAGAP